MIKNKLVMTGAFVGIAVMSTIKVGAQWYEWEPSWNEDDLYEWNPSWNEESWFEWENENESEKKTEEIEHIAESENGTEDNNNEAASGRICITDIQIGYPQPEREYDGTRDVPLQVKVGWLPQGVTLEAVGTAESADAGLWKVNCEFVLEGNRADEYWICTEEIRDQLEQLMVCIKPKTLSVWISDARKPYYEECQMENLTFLDQSGIEITGFVKDDEGREMIPVDFEYPELTIDESRLKKESCMFSNGQTIVYQGVIQLKKDWNGKYTGNPSSNYCFSQSNISNGNIYLQEAAITKGRDFIVTGNESASIWEDETGMFWLKKGGTPQIKIISECGFTEGVITEHDEVTGNGEIVLVRRNQYGEVIAQSEKYPLKWKEDHDAPGGNFVINGKSALSDKISYFNQPVNIQVQEDGSNDLKKVEMELIKKSENNYTGRTNVDTINWKEEKALCIKEDGVWKVRAKLTDQVGNERILESPDIILDRQEPEIQIEGITNGSANKGKVAPTIICQDCNYKKGSMKVHLEGKATGQKNVKYAMEETDTLAMVAIENLPIKMEWDDVYELTVNAQDLAGNNMEKKIVFSVNRFGSTYEVTKECEEQLEKYYLKESPKIVVRERNVDDLIASHILVLHDGELRPLLCGRDYQIQKWETAASRKEYRYTISEYNFREEGIYTVIISSEDRAQNASDNRMKDLKLEFAVDRSAPTILLTGIKDQDIFSEEGEKVCKLECHDNIALGEVQIMLNGKLLRKNCEIKQTLKLEKADHWQTLQVIAMDKAGNRYMGEKLLFWNGNLEPKPLESEEEGVKSGELFEEKQDMKAENKKKQTEKYLEEGKAGLGQKRQILLIFPVFTVISAIFFRYRNMVK